MLGELGNRHQIRLVIIALAAITAPVIAGCRDDGVVIGQMGNAGRGGAGGTANAGGAGGGGGGRGGASGATDGGVSVTDGGPLYAWTDLSPCHFPATIPNGYRTEPMVAFDSDRGKLIVYGSYGANDSDLWEVDTTTGLRTDRTTCAYVDTIPDYLSALVYDAGRKRVVMFPFEGASGVSEWDPVANVWTDRSAPAGTSAGDLPDGEGRVALYDPTARRVIVFVTGTAGANAPAIWSWDGATGAWTLLEADSPVTFSGEPPSMTFDSARGVIWGFGGSDPSFNPIDNFWTWNVTTGAYTDLTPATRPAAWPPARAAAGIAYDGTRGKLVVYGGNASGVGRHDIWEWDPVAATWTNRTAAGVSPTGGDPPSGVSWPGADLWDGNNLFADPAQSRVVLLQAADFMSIGASGAWLWNGQLGTWTQPTASTPPASWPSSPAGATSTAWDDDDRALYLAQTGELWRWTADNGVWTALAWPGGNGAPNSLPSLDGAALAYDPKAREIVMFGGYVTTDGTTPGGLTNDLWRWTPATSKLSMVSPPAGAAWPDPRRYHTMAYDPVRQKVVMFGGSKPEASNELWALDTASATWSDLSGGSTSGAGTWPEARIAAYLALDPERNVLVLKGGGDTSVSLVQALDATWELPAGTTSWSERAVASSSTPTAAPLAFLSGVGLVTLSGAWALNDGYFGLWRWDSASAVWTSLGVGAPTMATGDIFGPIGAAGRLLWLRAPLNDATVPSEDQMFFHLWQWGTQ